MTTTRRMIGEERRQVFRDRSEAGRVLARLLGGYRGREGVVVLGLARGGVPVAWEVAAALGAPLDAFIVRKLGAPGHEEFAMGALASGGRVVVNDDVVRALHVTPQQLRDVAEREGRELIRREAAYRGGRPPLELAGQDRDPRRRRTRDRAPACSPRCRHCGRWNPAEIVIAVPAAPESTCREFAGIVDDVVCASMPTPFLAVGESFWDFSQVSDEEVRRAAGHPDHGYRRPPGSGCGDARRGHRPRRGRRAVGRAAARGARGARRRRAHRADRREFTRHPRVLPGPRRDHEVADRGEGFLRGRRGGGLARRLPGQSLRARVGRRRLRRGGAERLRAIPGVDVAQHRGARLRGLAARAQRRRRAPSVERRRASTGWISTACTGRCGRWSTTSTTSTRGRGPGARTLRVLRPHLRRRRPGLRFRARLSARDCPASSRRSSNWSTCSAMRWTTRAATGCSPRTSCSTPSRTLRRCATPRCYYRAMFGGRVTSWNLRDQHMAQTLHALLAHLDRHDGADRHESCVWAHNSHVGDAQGHRGRLRRPADPGPTGARAVRRDARLIGFTHLHRDRDRGQRMGRVRRTQGRPARTDGQRGGIVPRDRQCRSSWCRRRSAGRPPTAGRRPAGPGDRRHLPAGHRTAEPLLSRPARRPVRRDHSHRQDDGAGTAGAHQRLGAGETPETYPTGL